MNAKASDLCRRTDLVVQLKELYRTARSIRQRDLIAQALSYVGRDERDLARVILDQLK